MLPYRKLDGEIYVLPADDALRRRRLWAKVTHVYLLGLGLELMHHVTDQMRIEGDFLLALSSLTYIQSQCI